MVTCLAIVWGVMEPLSYFGVGESVKSAGWVGALALVIVVLFMTSLRYVYKYYQIIMQLSEDIEARSATISKDSQDELIIVAADCSVLVAQQKRVLISEVLAKAAGDDFLKGTFASSLLSFYKMIGLIQWEVQASGEIQISSKSDKAITLLHALAGHIRDRVSLIEGASDDRFRDFIKALEKRRIATATHPSVLRNSRVNVVLIQALDESGQNVFLMQSSDGWEDNNYYWFMGAPTDHQGAGDPSLLIEEALAIPRSTIKVAPSPLLKCYDRNISRSTGIFSEYEFNVYLAKLNSSTVDWLTNASFTVHRQVRVTDGSARLSRNYAWLTWEQIKQIPELGANTPILLQSLDREVRKLEVGHGMVRIKGTPVTLPQAIS